MDGVPGETTQSSLNSCTSRLTSSPDVFKGKNVGGKPRRAFTLQDRFPTDLYIKYQHPLHNRINITRLGSTVKVLKLSLNGLKVIDGLRMKTKGEAGSIDGGKIKLKAEKQKLLPV
ncbi:hypothetical protein M9H77_13307 [Catharanthus roseus]|uniref:Uncharacterized protein n=1 Tax=Catharanthus roseus TaxID=4058 RepID=A0ACC0BJZ6_CATRO|nr:hypothetical protein M9H77_13307 [Catharanthus roseus]